MTEIFASLTIENPYVVYDQMDGKIVYWQALNDDRLEIHFSSDRFIEAYPIMPAAYRPVPPGRPPYGGWIMPLPAIKGFYLPFDESKWVKGLPWLTKGIFESWTLERQDYFFRTYRRGRYRSE